MSGQNAAFIDISNRIYERAPYFLLYIIGVTMLVLSMAFRSVVIAFKAASRRSSRPPWASRC